MQGAHFCLIRIMTPSEMRAEVQDNFTRPILLPSALPHPSTPQSWWTERNQAELSAVVHKQLLQRHKKYLKFTQITVTACQDCLWHFFNPFSQMFWILNLVSQWAFGYLFQLTPNAATPSTCSWLLFQLQDLSLSCCCYKVISSLGTWHSTYWKTVERRM